MTLWYVILDWPHLPTLRNIFLSAVVPLALCRRKSSTSRTCRPRATPLATFSQLDWSSTTCCSDTQFSQERNTMKSWIRIGPATLTSHNLSTSRLAQWHWICWNECYRKTRRKESRLRKPYNTDISAQEHLKCKNKWWKSGRHSSKSPTILICRASSPQWSRRPRRWSTPTGPALTSVETIRCIDSRRIGECIEGWLKGRKKKKKTV